MRRAWLWWLFCLGMCACERPPAAPGPGVLLEWQFPELPRPLAARAAGRRGPARMAARLPRNYRADRAFPLFIYLQGGPGGGGTAADLPLAESTVGREDFICVALPLFKERRWLAPAPRGLLVEAEDGPLLARCYRTMLERLQAAVPNVTPAGSVLGGHSNGAFTTSVLLAGEDPWAREHFRSFFLHEGGITAALGDALVRHGPRTLCMAGERGYGALPASQRGSFAELRQRLAGTGDITFVTMAGYGHEQPPEYLRQIGRWARGQPLEDVPATLQALARALPRPLTTHPETMAWPDLFNGDLSNGVCPAGAWNLRGGVLQATGAEPLWTRNDYAGCVLDGEFRCAAGGDSGLLLYGTGGQAMELQLGDDAATQHTEAPAPWQTGAFFGHQAPKARALRPAGEWNRFTLTCQGARVSLLLNGAGVNEVDLARWTNGRYNPDGTEIPPWLQGAPWAQRPWHGRLGVAGGAAVTFRNLKVLRLP